MTKRVKSKPSVDTIGPLMLSPADHLALTQADADAAVAAAEADRDLATLKLFHMETRVQAQQAEAALTEARAHAAATRERRRALAAELAERYAINWATHALEPLTGQVVPIDKDM